MLRFQLGQQFAFAQNPCRPGRSVQRFSRRIGRIGQRHALAGIDQNCHFARSRHALLGAALQAEKEKHERDQHGQTQADQRHSHAARQFDAVAAVEPNARINEQRNERERDHPAPPTAQHRRAAELVNDFAGRRIGRAWQHRRGHIA